MARHRQRASERKGRRRAEDGGNAPDERLHREEVPGSLDHASGEIDEAEASIVSGAGGAAEPIDDDEDLPANGATGAPARTAPAREGPGRLRFLNFLRACWAELQRVQWPDRRQVGQATAVVLGFVVVAGAFLGVIDLIAQQVVDLIL